MPDLKKYSLTKALFDYFEDDLQEFKENSDQEMNLSELFVQSRESQNLSQAELAAKIGTSPITLNEVETGDLLVSYDEMKTYFNF